MRFKCSSLTPTALVLDRQRLGSNQNLLLLRPNLGRHPRSTDDIRPGRH